MNRDLTERERQILQLMASGFTNKAVAQNLGIKISTVENHIHKIYQKLNIYNRAQATAYAFQTGLVVIVPNLVKPITE